MPRDNDAVAMHSLTARMHVIAELLHQLRECPIEARGALLCWLATDITVLRSIPPAELVKPTATGPLLDLDPRSRVEPKPTPDFHAQGGF